MALKYYIFAFFIFLTLTVTVGIMFLLGGQECTETSTVLKVISKTSNTTTVLIDDRTIITIHGRTVNAGDEVCTSWSKDSNEDDE